MLILSHIKNKTNNFTLKFLFLLVDNQTITHLKLKLDMLREDEIYWSISKKFYNIQLERRKKYDKQVSFFTAFAI